ncbi:MAG: WHG domain-containing protein [Caldilineaceae bacterium]
MARRPGLDRDAVVRAAVELLDSEGAGTLSLGRVADRLGVQTPSLYNHVEGMPGLLRQLALRNARDMAACMGDAAMGRSGPEAVLAVAEAYRAYIKQHAGLYMASLRTSGAQAQDGSPPDAELAEAEARVVRIVLAVLASFGLSGEDAIHAVRGLRSVVHGFATLEVAGGFGLPLDCDESFRRLVGLLVAGLREKVS